MKSQLLELRDVRMYYQGTKGEIKAVDGVSLSVETGETLGIAGESGCGKSSLALTILRLLPLSARIAEGSIIYRDNDLTKFTEEQMRYHVRWKRIAMVFQGAMNALCPVVRVSDQIVEAIRVHERITKDEARRRALALLEIVGIDGKRAIDFPFRFSGGMRQRAMIALALSLNPELLIADEPTTALDVIVQAQILDLLKELRKRLDLTIIIISHDISVLANTCNRLAIMYAGQIAEVGRTEDILSGGKHPYTQGLLSAFPSLHRGRGRLTSISGSPPDLLQPPNACRFHPRCPYAFSRCALEDPSRTKIASDWEVFCHLYR